MEWHEGRRVKTKTSIRSVPLVGDALEAAMQALQLPRGKSSALFPRYAKERSADSVSQLLNKYVKAVVGEDSKKVVYSLRHSMKDLLRLAGAPIEVQEGIAGRTTGGIGESYGSDEVKCRVYHEWLTKALAQRSVCD